jgi:hypothetical protein
MNQRRDREQAEVKRERYRQEEMARQHYKIS